MFNWRLVFIVCILKQSKTKNLKSKERNTRTILFKTHTHIHSHRKICCKHKTNAGLFVIYKMPNTIFICCHQNMNSKSKVQKQQNNEKILKKGEEDEEASICHDTVYLSIIKHIFRYDVWKK